MSEDGDLTGSWYFTPDNEELYVSDEDGSYMVATMYARYGYWLEYPNGEPTGIRTSASSPANMGDLNLAGEGDPVGDVTASYTGNAAGISVRDKTSGHFTAAVSLTATFGTAPMLGGSITGFEGKAVDPGWTVVLKQTALGATDANLTAGIAYGGEDAGVWTAQGYGPTPVDHDDNGATDLVNQRPEGFFGRFNANMLDGTVVGAYTTRADD